MKNKEKFLPGDLVKLIVDKNMRIVVASDDTDVTRFVNFVGRPLSRIDHVVTKDWNHVWRIEQ